MNTKITSLQGQIDRLGEEIALDINQLEKDIKKGIKEHNNSYQFLPDQKLSSVAKSFASLQEESNLTDEKIMKFLRDMF